MRSLPALRLFLSSRQHHDDPPSSHKHMGRTRPSSADAHGCALNKSFVLNQAGPPSVCESGPGVFSCSATNSFCVFPAQVLKHCTVPERKVMSTTSTPV